MLYDNIIFILMITMIYYSLVINFFFFQAEDGIRDAQESRGLGDVYKRQMYVWVWVVDDMWLKLIVQHLRSWPSSRSWLSGWHMGCEGGRGLRQQRGICFALTGCCLLYTSDAADEEDSVDLGGCRIIKKKRNRYISLAERHMIYDNQQVKI
eukprot:TRINITY_DN31572_c0_g1_i1.p1 TRINITY_DN31572_c0_g1~~TRINITY_DN31572_c0_g1_i1.p1  ORF type:complete len:152 (+),score=16.92 TRINITY_DN31572_c0_g1_i1:2-457(+)